MRAGPGNYRGLLFGLKLRLDAEGIAIPCPRRELHLFEENK